MILKAEYLFRPRQLLRRLATRRAVAASALTEVVLPWNRRIVVSRDDNIGAAVLALGVYDLVVSETLWRLIDPTDVVLDVGANVGCMTAVMAERAAEVHCFEPHPALFVELSGNADRLAAQGTRARICPHQLALSSASGPATLHVPADCGRQRGESSMVAGAQSGAAIDVATAPLDWLPVAEGPIGVMKLDVEGAEINVLRGAQRLLRDRRLRDCVFEEHRSYPTDVTTMLEAHGFRIFRLARGLMRPRLLPAESTDPRSDWEATSFLATLQPERAARRMASLGWRCLGW